VDGEWSNKQNTLESLEEIQNVTPDFLAKSKTIEARASLAIMQSYPFMLEVFGIFLAVTHYLRFVFRGSF